MHGTPEPADDARDDAVGPDQPDLPTLGGSFENNDQVRHPPRAPADGQRTDDTALAAAAPAAPPPDKG